MFCNGILKVTQFCKKIKQQTYNTNLSDLQLIMSCQDCPYLVQPICPWKKPVAQ